jgi:hypothetical protein
MLPSSISSLFLYVLALTGATRAILPDGRLNANMRKRSLIPYVDSPGLPIKSRNGTELPPYSTIYYFDQLIDHNNPSLGTFKQRYWHTYEFYEPGKFHSFITSFGLVMPSTGGPIILMTPGEANAQGGLRMVF